VAAEMLTEKDVRELLVTVGVSPLDAGGDLGRSFEDLELDSLARLELASQIKERAGVEVEEDLTPQQTPTGMQQLVNQRLADASV
jgi:acyl carrier protein